MKRRTVSIILLIIYCTILIKVMVFKDMPTLHIGQLMLNFGGTDGGHPANFIPFRTIVPYLFSDQALIAGVNLAGNIALLVPIGLLVPLAFRNLNWKGVLLIAVTSGLAIELLQVILQIGIFDIDDVILNGLGVLIGYGLFVVFSRWMRAKNYKNISIAVAVVVVSIVAAFCAVYPWGRPVMSPEDRAAHQRLLVK